MSPLPSAPPSSIAESVPRNMVSFASSVVRLMMLGGLSVLGMSRSGVLVRGSSTSSSMWSPGSVALQVVPPSAERKRCHAACGTTAIIPARTTKDFGGPSSQTMSWVFLPSRT
jgi:hypothetical protein